MINIMDFGCLPPAACKHNSVVWFSLQTQTFDFVLLANSVFVNTDKSMLNF